MNHNLDKADKTLKAAMFTSDYRSAIQRLTPIIIMAIPLSPEKGQSSSIRAANH